MIYNGNYEVENIVVHDEVGDSEIAHCISITTGKHEPVFSVTCCCDPEWIWKFWYSKSNYELIKFQIMDCIVENETMEELLESLDEVFEEDYNDILFDEDECDGDCENCEFCD